MPLNNTNVFGDHIRRLDSRLTNLRYVNTAYAGPVAATLGECRERAAIIRRRILLAAGLWPMPERTPLNAHVYDRQTLDGCTVEKVYFESRPGFLVTGNLYRPLKWRGKRPGILSPHGHHATGRLTISEHTNIPGRCMMLARLGFVAFTYDMAGYNDSCQLEHRPPAETIRRLALYGISLFGLQLWNGVRAVDFLCSLPDVDANRIGNTGLSGGGTHTYYLGAVDDRVRALVPACMMASHYQGGCNCEEGAFLHLDDISTLDVVASLAPRPVLLPSVTGDWTSQNPGYDVPAVRQIYAIFGAADRVENQHREDTHSFPREAREYMYAWFSRWLANDRGVGRRIKEPLLTPPPASDLRLFPDGKPPKGYLSGPALIEELIRRARAEFQTPPENARRLRALKAKWAQPYAEILGAQEPEEMVSVGPPWAGGKTEEFTATARIIGRRGRGEQIPALFLASRKAARNAPAALVVCGKGKQELFGKGNRPSPLLASLLDAGVRVLAIDLLGKGEMAGLIEQMPVKLDDPLYYSFNRSLTAHRVQEILTALAVLRWHDGVKRPALIGTGIGAVAALLARPLAGELSATALDLCGCRTGDEAFWLGEAYHPLLGMVGNARGAILLGPLSPLTLAGAGKELALWARTTYSLQGKAKSLRLIPGALDPKSASRWL